MARASHACQDGTLRVVRERVRMPTLMRTHDRAAHVHNRVIAHARRGARAHTHTYTHLHMRMHMHMHICTHEIETPAQRDHAPCNKLSSSQ